MLFKLSILVALVVTVTRQTSAASTETESATALCNNKKFQLTRISQVRALVSSPEASGPACAIYKASMEQIDVILADLQNELSCSLETVDKIRGYHNTFMAPTKTKQPIPNALKLFFVSLAFQISAQCKMSLIVGLEKDTAGLILPSDYAVIDLLEQSGSNENSDSNGVFLNDFDDIILIDEVMTVANTEQNTRAKLLIKTKTNLAIRKLISTCTNKFKPFYDRLIMPLIGLSNLGYNYKGELLARELKELKENKLVSKWYDIVQTCEAFKSIEIFEDDSEQVGEDSHAITLISGKEAEELRARDRQVKCSDQDCKEKPIVYRPNVSTSDVLWIQDQAELSKMVNKYKASKSEAIGMRNKLFRKLLARFYGAFKSGELIMFISDSVKKENVKHSLGEDLVNMLDENIEAEEQASNKSKAQTLDTAVAGPKPKQTYPRKIRAPKKVNGTKLTTWLKDHTFGKFLPGKLDSLIIVAVVIAGLVLIVHLVG